MAMQKGSKIDRSEKSTLVLYIRKPDGALERFSEADANNSEQCDWIVGLATTLGQGASKLVERVETTTVRSIEREVVMEGGELKEVSNDASGD